MKQSQNFSHIPKLNFREKLWQPSSFKCEKTNVELVFGRQIGISGIGPTASEAIVELLRPRKMADRSRGKGVRVVGGGGGKDGRWVGRRGGGGGGLDEVKD